MFIDKSATQHRNVSLNTYKRIKLQMLERDFCVHPEPEEIQHLNALKSEVAVDQFVTSLLDKYWS